MSKDCEFQEIHSEVYVEWKIKRFFVMLKGFAYSLKSSNFLLADAKWFLQVYPKWSNEILCLQMSLCRDCASSEKHRIAYTMGIKNSNGSKYGSINGELEFLENDSFECMKLEISKLQDSEDGSLTIFIQARILEANILESHPSMLFLESTNTLTKNLKDLLLSGHHGDTTIKVKDREFPVHRSILSARSPVFSKMFDHDMVEKACGTINIDDCDPDDFQDFLLFLYTSKMEHVRSNNAPGLYKIADKYDMNELKEECTRSMIREMSVDSFCDVVLTAAVYNESEVLENATAYFAQNFNAILPTSKWQKFLSEHTMVANELLIKMGSKTIIKQK